MDSAVKRVTGRSFLRCSVVVASGTKGLDVADKMTSMWLETRRLSVAYEISNVWRRGVG